MQGFRVADNAPMPEGGYGRQNGVWHARPPGQHMGSLAEHNVFEELDGTITVFPSILITSEKGEWHGYLEKGVWRAI